MSGRINVEGLNYNDYSDDIQRIEMMTSPVFQETVREIIYTLIPQVKYLGELYLNWETLSEQEKKLIYDDPKGNEIGMELFKPLLDALKMWDDVQNTYGAPGFDSVKVDFNGLPQCELTIANTIVAVEELVRNLKNDTGNGPLATCGASLLPLLPSAPSPQSQNECNEQQVQYQYAPSPLSQNEFDEQQLQYVEFPDEQNQGNNYEDEGYKVGEHHAVEVYSDDESWLYSQVSQEQESIEDFGEFEQEVEIGVLNTEGETETKCDEKTLDQREEHEFGEYYEEIDCGRRKSETETTCDEKALNQTEEQEYGEYHGEFDWYDQEEIEFDTKSDEKTLGTRLASSMKRAFSLDSIPKFSKENRRLSQ